MHNVNTQNLQHHLLMRELNLNPGRRHPVPRRFRFYERNFYKSITPRLTVLNVDKPHGYLRKFTPDGKLLLVFTIDQKSLDVYRFMGVGSAADLLSQQQEECVTAWDQSLQSLNIRQELFNRLFKKKFHLHIITSPIPQARHIVNREFSLFVDDGNYVIISSTAGGSIFPNYLDNLHYPDLFDDTDLYNYTFYLVDLRSGKIADTLKMERDYIVLPNNHSVSLYDRTLAILSTYRQCIELFEINVVLGKFQPLYTLGPFGDGLDRDRVLALESDNNFVLDPTLNVPFSHLKQKVLAFTYREIMAVSSLNDRKKFLKDFYRSFEQFERMLILKMQLIDNDNLLMRYERRQRQMPLELFVGCNVNHPITSKNHKLYVVYNLTEQKIIRILRQDSIELLKILRNFCDDFRNVHSLHIPWKASSPSNNHVFRSAFDQALRSFPGGVFAAASRFNHTLPISSQSFSTSPFLNYVLYNYDDRFVSTLERPRLNSSEPIRFWDRSTGRLKFRIFLEEINDDDSDEEYEYVRTPRDLVSYIFHPYEPFFISIQRLISRYVINFHLYNSKTITKT